MGNFNENNQSEIARFILDNLPRHELCALGTVDGSGNPWVVCVGLTFDKKMNVIWKSSVDAEHSKNILKNPNVAISVFSKTEGIGDFGLYMKGTAREVTNETELREFLDIKYKRKEKEVPSPDSLLGDSKFRIYYAEVKEAWVAVYTIMTNTMIDAAETVS